MSDWIPCKKRLPDMHPAVGIQAMHCKEVSDWFLITVKNGDSSVVLTEVARLEDGEWDYLRTPYAVEREYEVTAWMPLPEPYDEESDIDQERTMNDEFKITHGAMNFTHIEADGSLCSNVLGWGEKIPLKEIPKRLPEAKHIIVTESSPSGDVSFEYYKDKEWTIKDIKLRFL